jgi:hypothetical protein
MTAPDAPRCRACGAPLQPVHGHGACLASACPMFGINQDPCCNGLVPDVPAAIEARPARIGWQPVHDPGGKKG